jgi:hypothetical protein
MAHVWFARRRGGQWVVPGGKPVFDKPLSALIFPLDLGTHRRLVNETLVWETELPAEPTGELSKVVVEATAEDLSEHDFSGYEVGLYDSPYSPSEIARRLAAS